MRRQVIYIGVQGERSKPDPAFERQLAAVLLQALAADGRLTPAQYRSVRSSGTGEAHF